MAETWAKIGGADLHLELSGTRVRASLETALRGALRAGRLRPGTRLPSSRALAADLGIARNTVAEVYSQLVAEGWLTAQAGAGTSVAARLASGQDPAAAAAAEPDVPRYDLRAGAPALSAFPRRAWQATARRVLAAAPDYLLGYPDPRGLPQLRAALADYLARARGVVADPALIVICGGFSHGLAAVSRALRSGGADTLAVEAYGHQAHRNIARQQGLRLRPVPVDDRGAVVGTASGADAVLLTPAHQFPLGVALHPRRRREVVDWGGLVIEDDYDGEFRYDRQPVGALQPLAPDRVIYAGTASKSLAPGLRLGWLVVPPRLLDAVTAELATGPSGLDQLTLTEFITAGDYDRQVRRARLGYRRRRDRLAATLGRQGWRPGGIAAGLQVVLEFPETGTERAVLAAAVTHGLALDGLSHYRAGGSNADSRAGLVIGFARPPEHAYTTALARLSAVLPPPPRDLLPLPYPRPGREPRRPPGRTPECTSQRADRSAQSAGAGQPGAGRRGDRMTQHRDAGGSGRGPRARAARARAAIAVAGIAVAATVLATAGIAILPGAPARAAASIPAGASRPAAQLQLAPGPGEWWFGSWHVAQEVWPLAQGAGVTVAVLDTGVQASLPGLRGVVLRGGDTSQAGPGHATPGDTDGDAANDGHGTAIATLIAGQGYGNGIVGVAPRARILPVRVGDAGADSAAAAAAGIRFAVRHGARVINMSFGGQVSSPRSCDPVLAGAVGYALAHDVVLVAAAGDAGVLPGPMEPASCPGVLAVGGTGPDGTWWPGSTRAPYVAVAAPGEQITFAGMDGRHSTTATGTSFSSALVAGTAALIRSRYPAMPWYQVDQRLIGTAAAAGRQVPSDAYGYGLVDPAEAVNAAAYPLPRSAPNPVYARFRAWLAGLSRASQAQDSQATHGQATHGQAQHSPGPGRQAAVSLASATRPPAGVTVAQAAVIATGAAGAFAAALVLALWLPSRRRAARRDRGRRHARHRGPGHARPAVAVNREWERRTWSFGPSPDGSRGASPSYWPNGAGGSSDGWSR